MTPRATVIEAMHAVARRDHPRRLRPRPKITAAIENQGINVDKNGCAANFGHIPINKGDLKGQPGPESDPAEMRGGQMSADLRDPQRIAARTAYRSTGDREGWKWVFCPSLNMP